ncbi:M48 family metallopeptidase [Humitalea sp. 24SJ18S-53]|uniref:M48 family metallopeptidase n=1 Tax=Humitalea sp. 24SJ18S-53 TaxID=3422307 RepID=UPI003D663CDC
MPDESTRETLPLAPDPLAPPVDVQVVWQRSARARRVSLRIDAAEGAVLVTLPTRGSRKAGLALLQTHARWITQRLRALAPACPFVPGAMVPIGGLPHEIIHAPDERGGAFLHGQTLVVTGDETFLARRTADFLRAEAGRRLAVRVAHHATAISVVPHAIRLKDTRTRWGSCAADRTLAFSWRLLLAPDWVLDYVAAHEVAHIRHMNHGVHFWALLNTMSPHRAQAETWLKRHGPGLLRVGA